MPNVVPFESVTLRSALPALVCQVTEVQIEISETINESKQLTHICGIRDFVVIQPTIDLNNKYLHSGVQ